MMIRFNLLLALIALAGIAMANEWPITLTDYTGRGFPPDLVSYTAPTPAAGQAYRLQDATGKAVPVQVSPGEGVGTVTVRFVTALPANGAVTYTLTDTRGTEPATIGSNLGAKPPVVVWSERNAAGAKTGRIQMANNLFTIIVPDERAMTYANPVPAHTLPAPIIAWGKTGEMGSGRMLSTRPIKAFRVKLAATGPVYAELRYEIDFA